MNDFKPIAITVGEPAGIGPDIVLALATSPYAKNCVIIADKTALAERANLLGIAQRDFSKLIIEHHPLPSKVTPGTPKPQHAQCILQTVKRAAQGCLNNEFAAMVTGPIHKASINAAGIVFSGHTEFLANVCDVKKTVMLFFSDHLKMALLTTHHPLKTVPDLVTANHLYETIHIIHRDCKKYLGMTSPHIVVCGLNPHAGEAGTLGKEEQTIMQPVIQRVKQEDIQISGPVAADTVFRPGVYDEHTVILATYHDQGLPAMKALYFHKLTNVTLGLPIIRTSVDHGTALSLAGGGKANTESLLYAIHSAMIFTQHLCPR